jgi:regulator of sirC expression with transglutaminase-like and TPR domain
VPNIIKEKNAKGIEARNNPPPIFNMAKLCQCKRTNYKLLEVNNLKERYQCIMHFVGENCILIEKIWQNEKVAVCLSQNLKLKHMNYQRFDRHECFTQEMMTMTSEVIRECEDVNVMNMMYGLYDGYLYGALLPEAIKSGVSKESENKIRGLIKAIDAYIKIHGDKKVTLF